MGGGIRIGHGNWVGIRRGLGIVYRDEDVDQVVVLLMGSEEMRHDDGLDWMGVLWWILGVVGDKHTFSTIY